MSTRALCVLLGISLCAMANAQYSTDFESPPFEGSAEGVIITGQDEFYLPPAESSTDGKVYTYADNVLGIPNHPTSGGEQFEAGVNTATLFARAQRDVAIGDGKWIIAADVCANFIDTLPAAQYLGSLSHNRADQLTFNFVALATWVDVNVADAWSVNAIYFDGAGNQLQTVLDSNFQNLPIKKWYRWSTQFDTTTNKIDEIKLTDLEAGETFTFVPTDWYMRGGSGGGEVGTCFRMFTGGVPEPGNVMAWDNFSLSAVPQCTADCADSNCDGAVDFNDIDCFVAAVISDESWDECSACGVDDYFCTNDINKDGAVDFNDIDGFVNAIINGACD